MHALIRLHQTLSWLQDNIDTFPTPEARALVEAELGAPIDELFSEFSEVPVAAASLAQVYRARLRATGEEVAVKVQRPDALSTISKDLCAHSSTSLLLVGGATHSIVVVFVIVG